MQIIKNTLNKDSTSKYPISDKTCFIDIETTGLNRQYNSIYLIGMLYYEQDNWVLLQIFADLIDEEEKVLTNFISLLSKYNKIITFNGDSFDIPFINYRLGKYGIFGEIKEESSLDLYKIVKRNKDYLNLENLKLKTLEKYIGIYRDDIYSGKECIDFYFEYTRTKNIELAQRVLKHNFDDLYYMPDIIKILQIINEKKTLKIQINDFELSLLLHNINIKGDLFKLSGDIDCQEQIKLLHFDNSFKLSFMDDNTFELVIEINKGLVTPDTIGIYINLIDLNLSEGFIDYTSYNMPKNIILLKVENRYFMDNIMRVLKEIVLYTLSGY
ncbi:hypothetical protein E9840_05305 [Tissierella creatinini]|nr:hypothetical protein E9840_05305 [Tissierella creatinini]TJX62780.1 hypothetical protein E8P77_16460 [Soehngenia saccharolytica]